MTYAELLRKHATDATNEGGMWFSGEYMTMLASMAESVEAENDKLREWASKYAEIANYFCEREGYCSHDFAPQCRYFKSRQCKLGELNDALREFGIEVDE